VPSTDQKDTSSVYDENSQFARKLFSNKFHYLHIPTMRCQSVVQF